VTTSAQVAGAPGLARELVAHVLAEAGVALADQPGDADVVVLVDPVRDEWAAAGQAGRPVVLVASTPLAPDAAVDAVAQGADAVLDAETSPARIVEAVAATASGGAYLDDAQTASLARALRAGTRAPAGSRRVPALTNREKEILASIERGESVKQTARTLGIAQKTVENLQGRLFSKLDVRNRAQAVAKAHVLGLLGRPGQGTPTAV
jgi:DNA-binding NarL/FixJ family response regulator